MASPRTYTYAREALMAYDAMMMPSITACGSFIMSGRSLQVPGSPSSALTTR
jgi:hypothetical protein